MVRSGAIPRVLAVGGDHPNLIAPSAAGCGYRCCCGDHRLEHTRPHERTAVEEHREPPMPWDLVLADHELVVTRRRWPVHPTEVVADDVLAECVELVAARRDLLLLNRLALEV